MCLDWKERDLRNPDSEESAQAAGGNSGLGE
jgi:hypothetical protein